MVGRLWPQVRPATRGMPRSRAVSRATRQREVPARTLLCLEVLEERGLIRLNRRTDRIQITLCQVEHKVDLEASEIIRRLRKMLEEEL